jgi:hypothetical protein
VTRLSVDAFPISGQDSIFSLDCQAERIMHACTAGRFDGPQLGALSAFVLQAQTLVGMAGGDQTPGPPTPD